MGSHTLSVLVVACVAMLVCQGCSPSPNEDTAHAMACNDEALSCNWISQAECDAGMGSKCKRTCNLCSVGGNPSWAASCNDEALSCNWITQAECAAGMGSKCKRTCNLCSVGGNPSWTAS